MTYDEDNDIFISKKPYASWTSKCGRSKMAITSIGDEPALPEEEQTTHRYEAGMNLQVLGIKSLDISPLDILGI